MCKPILRTLALCCLLLSTNVLAREYLVDSFREYQRAAERVRAGDTIILSKGNWVDFEILLDAEGTEEEPITLTVEEKGQTIISGQSNLRLAGEHLVVSGLVFMNGYTPTDSVISFRKDSENVANHSRVTETVIYNFNNPDRFTTDYWVTLFGKNNRFDHNHLEGKSNQGVTMAVRLSDEQSRENHHQIDHNYFGPRPILGSNGGETLRIGTSHYSLTNSYTLVENNFFDRCDGEVEIVSNKSGGNIFRGNVFYESRGTLTLRHGSGNLIENNVFFGNGVENTGGIRVINADQTIRNNYLEGLTGERFWSGLTVMNGIYDSPINRYHQVDGAVIENNSLIELSNIGLGIGSDEERNAPPVNSVMRNNLIFNQSGADNFTIDDDVSGIEFDNNIRNNVTRSELEAGFTSAEIPLQRAANGLLYPVGDAYENVGASRDLNPIEKAQTGVVWFPKSDGVPEFASGELIMVEPGIDTLATAVAGATDGDILLLAAGDYRTTRVINVNKRLVLTTAEYDSDVEWSEPSVTLTFDRSTLFEIKDNGSLYLQGLRITGEHSPDSAGNSVIRTALGTMRVNYELIVEGTEVRDLDVNHSFDFLSATKGTFANRIDIFSSRFSNITGGILKLDSETDDYGIYNAEYVEIADSLFTDIQGPLVDFYRGGTDESTSGPHLLMTDTHLQNVGLGSRNRDGGSLVLHGVQRTNVSGNQFEGSAPIVVRHTVGEPVTVIQDNDFVGTSAPEVVELNSGLPNTAIISDNRFGGGAQ